MREPLTSLQRADAIIITKADQSLDILAALEERLRAINPTAIMATAIHEPVSLRDALTGEAISPDRLEQMPLSLLSSIGDPEGFEETVRRLGATVVSHTAFPDHHRYRTLDWQHVLHAASTSRAQALVTTEKDVVRLQALLTPHAETRLPIWVLRIQMRLVSGEEQLDARLARLSTR